MTTAAKRGDLDTLPFGALIGSRSGSWAWPAAGLALVAALQFSMIFERAINWDEFHHYSLVHLFGQGTLSQPLQTFYVRLFAWLPGLSGTSVDQIVVARTIMFACELAAAAAIAVLARRFADGRVGLLCALCYLSAGFVLQHGFSFRADPMVAALLMSALCILACTSMRGVALLAFGGLLALAALITIKIVLYAPAFAGILWLRFRERTDALAFVVRVGLAGLAGLLSFALLYAFHAGSATQVQGSASGMLQQSAGKMFQLGLPVYWRYIIEAAITAPVFAILIALLPATLRRSSLERPARLAIWGMALPIAVLAFYHNTAPYFYTFILAPVAVACAVPMAAAMHRYGAAALTIAFSCNAVLIWAVEDRGVLDRQRAVLMAAESIFPTPVHYFDFCAMLPAFPKANNFMTPWGVEVYKKGGAPALAETMRTKVVPLVIDNDAMFTRLLQTDEPTPEFLPEDAAALRATYRHFWGPLWLAAAAIPPGDRATIIEIRVPGPYTLSRARAVVNDRLLRPGEVINLVRGPHRVRAEQPAMLTWGNRLQVPRQAPPPTPHWTGF